MSTVRETIIVEDKIKAILDHLQIITVDNIDYSHSFKYGSNKELLKYLISNQNPYPLIWLIYPYTEVHTDSYVDINNLSIVISVLGNDNQYNEDRMEISFKKFLLPLLDNMKRLFLKANTLDSDYIYNITKYFNYSNTDREEENQTIAIWDAIKVTFKCKIYKNKLNINML